MIITFWAGEGDDEFVTAKNLEAAAFFELEVVENITTWSVLRLGHAVHWTSVVELAVKFGSVALGLLNIRDLSLWTDESTLVV